MSPTELNAALFARGLLHDYKPSLFDVTAVMLRLFDPPPVQVNQMRLR